MSIIISQITIESTSVAWVDNGKYKVSLTWKINGNPAISCLGDYDICLSDGTGEIETQTAVNADNSATVTFEKLTDDGNYTVKVRAPQERGGVESPEADLIIDHFKGFSGSYDGASLSLAWEWEDVKLKDISGTCTIRANNGYSCAYEIFPGSERAVLAVACGRMFTAQAYSKKYAAEGPTSDVLTFYTAPPFITDAEITNGDSGTGIAVRFTSEHDDIETVSLVLRMNGEKVYESKPVKVAKADSGYSVIVNVDSAELTRGEIDKCTVSCAYINGSAKSILCGDGSEMPLARPSVSAVDIQGGKAVMRISYPENAATRGFELSDGSVVSGNNYTVDLSAQTPAIRPRFDRNGTVRRGVSSEAVPGFIPGYYVSGGGLVYRGTDFSEAAVIHTWNEELFKNPPAKTIESGTLSLAHGDNGYTLTIGNEQNLSLDDYRGFIDKIKDSITPFGFFALNDVILRIAPQAFDDTPYLLCAHSPSERTADIRPGLRLTANTAVYMPQYNPDTENVEGFVSTNSAGWNFVLNSDGSFLEPDLFIGQMAKYMNNGSLNSATKVIFASGVADFMRPSLHQPYYRVLFPLSLEPSLPTEDPYLAENTMIMTSESYGEILDACRTIKDDPLNINTLNIPLIIFRGRSALSLSVPVQINGNLYYVPVGCSVKQALRMHGYGYSASVKIKREDDEGIPRPVFAGKNEGLGNLTLISGDRLEV